MIICFFEDLNTNVDMFYYIGLINTTNVVLYQHNIVFYNNTPLINIGFGYFHGFNF